MVLEAYAARGSSTSICAGGPTKFNNNNWGQLFTVDTIWNIGETGDIYLRAIDLKNVFS